MLYMLRFKKPPALKVGIYPLKIKNAGERG
jgi:hypothetical protein